MTTNEPAPVEQLLPCPFCGNTASCFEGDGRFYVLCDNLACYCALGEGWDRDAMPDHCFLSREDAITAWNTRIASTPTAEPDEGLVEKVAQAICLAEQGGPIGYFPNGEPMRAGGVWREYDEKQHEEWRVVARAALAAATPSIRAKALEDAANTGYRVCAETRHVTLGDKVAAAIRSLAGEQSS